MDTGLATNPVHVLDLAIFLPAMALAGVLLARRHASGFGLAPVVLGAVVPIGLGIVCATLSLTSAGSRWPGAPAVVIAALTAVELVLLVRFLRSVDPKIALHDVLR